MDVYTDKQVVRPEKRRLLHAPRSAVRGTLLLLSRRKWHLAGITVLIVSLAALVLIQLTPIYRATALVMLDSRKAAVLGDSGAITLPEASAIETEIEVLKSGALLGRVVDKLKLEVDPEFGAAPDEFPSSIFARARAIFDDWFGRDATPKPASSTASDARSRAIETLSRNVSVTTRGRSQVIAVSMESSNPIKAKQLVDALADFYLVDQLQAKLEASRRTTEFFGDRLAELRQSIQTTERELAAYREKLGLPADADANIALQSLSELSSQLNQARAQRAEKESRLTALNEAARNPATAGNISEVVASPLISMLRVQEAEIGRRMGELQHRYGDSHPRLAQAKAELGQILSRIASEIGKIIASVQSDAEAARAKELQLQQAVTKLEHQVGGAGRNDPQLRQLERDLQAARSVYEDFLARSKETRNQQNGQQPDARVLSLAAIPMVPVFPRYAQTIAVAFFVGLMIGGVVVLLLERLDSGFRTEDDVERLTGRSVVGMVPMLNRGEAEGLGPARFAIEKSASIYAEALRSTFTAISLKLDDQLPRVLMVTSSLPDEGKSTFACSLAGLVARSNPEKKVVIVDCDLRRSAVASTLALANNEGSIDEYLAGTKTLDQVIGRDVSSGLYYILAKSNTPNSAELLDSSAMRSFIRALGGQFDLVILDTPPLMAVADSRIAAQVADYIVFLIRWQRTSRELAVNALRLLQDLHKEIGIVLSQVDVRRHARYGYGDYDYYYSKYRSYYTK